MAEKSPSNKKNPKPTTFQKEYWILGLQAFRISIQRFAWPALSPSACQLPDTQVQYNGKHYRNGNQWLASV